MLQFEAFLWEAMLTWLPTGQHGAWRLHSSHIRLAAKLSSPHRHWSRHSTQAAINAKVVLAEKSMGCVIFLAGLIIPVFSDPERLIVQINPAGAQARPGAVGRPLRPLLYMSVCTLSAQNASSPV